MKGNYWYYREGGEGLNFWPFQDLFVDHRWSQANLKYYWPNKSDKVEFEQVLVSLRYCTHRGEPIAKNSECCKVCCCWLVVQLFHLDAVQENAELGFLLDFTFSSLFHFQHRFLDCGCWQMLWIFEDLDWQKSLTPLVSIEVFTTKEDGQHLLWKDDKIILHLVFVSSCT